MLKRIAEWLERECSPQKTLNFFRLFLAGLAVLSLLAICAGAVRGFFL
ncbi:MAG: hypothetical protein LBU39_08570 [Desulfobulbaceae bacterium]|nr:hypothetical protein [Desulfobulbaceae bacterium]